MIMMRHQIDQITPNNSKPKSPQIRRKSPSQALHHILSISKIQKSRKTLKKRKKKKPMSSSSSSHNSPSQPTTTRSSPGSLNPENSSSSTQPSFHTADTSAPSSPTSFHTADTPATAQQAPTGTPSPTLCSVCYEPLTPSTVATLSPCNHATLCSNCVTHWLSNQSAQSLPKTCPLCRSPITAITTASGTNPVAQSRPNDPIYFRIDLPGDYDMVPELQDLLRWRPRRLSGYHWDVEGEEEVVEGEEEGGEVVEEEVVEDGDYVLLAVQGGGGPIMLGNEIIEGLDRELDEPQLNQLLDAVDTAMERGGISGFRRFHDQLQERERRERERRERER
ncbi:hypothetical protein FN846DRAFT_1009174 [Sphaerosporella brunnea]|uniref:RING-type domain-containing protein n=1 Tax=Sphaerosporella brunnea TaxID=1250544 RepID=A0A5J5F131_9PEZI|nr:hypothetical protein FN846DRAFT_1009174 [Sphaerosporella brunnea]